MPPPPFVFMAFESTGSFIEIDLLPEDTGARLLARGRGEFERLGVLRQPTLLTLHLVATNSTTREPTGAEVLSTLSKFDSSRVGAGLLDRTIVDSGAWLVAKCLESHIPPPLVPTAPDPVALLAAFYSQPLDQRQKEELRFSDALIGDRAMLQTGAFNSRHLGALLRKLESVVASTTRQRMLSSSGIVLDGPLSGAKGQASTSILLALRDGEAFFAKVGPVSTMHREWQVSQAIHQGRTVPTVARAILYEEVPSARGQGMLLMPLYPVSAAVSREVLSPPTSPSPFPSHGLRQHACRDALVAKVAVCAFAAIHAFASAGWAHGDIKPGNIMLTGCGSPPFAVIDFGAARPLGEALAEWSEYGMEAPPLACLAYDLACLATTLALLQYEDLPLSLGKGTRTRLRGAVEEQDERRRGGVAEKEDGGAGDWARPPGSFAVEVCLQLSLRAEGVKFTQAGETSGGGGGGCFADLLAGLREAADAVAEAARVAGIMVPPVETLWSREDS